jgi:hypothetical protein
VPPAASESRTRSLAEEIAVKRLAVPALVLVAAWGCTPAETTPRQPVLVPVGGTITVDGKPLAVAVVTFLQVDESGTTSGGETDENGRYELVYGATPGTAPASYKVAVSYLVGKNGKPIGRRARSSLSEENPVHLAKEQLPPEYSDLGRTVLKATVPPAGGTIDFDLKGGLRSQAAAGEDGDAAEKPSP